VQAEQNVEDFALVSNLQEGGREMVMRLSTLANAHFAMLAEPS